MSSDKIIQKLIEHDERLDRIEKKIDKTVSSTKYTEGYDEMITILKRLDQERIFTAEWVRRIGEEVNNLKRKTQEYEDILQKVKIQLKIT